MNFAKLVLLACTALGSTVAYADEIDEGELRVTGHRRHRRAQRKHGGDQD